MDLNKKEIGQRLKTFANNYGGVSKLAEALEISGPNLSGSYISGKSIPGGELIAKLITLGCDVGWLLTGKESQKTINNESPINGHGNAVSNVQEQGNVSNKIAVGETVELEVLREKVKYLEDKNKLLDEIITDLRKQNNYLLQRLTGGEK